MRLVHDDVLEVVIREPGESLFLRKRLHRADRHRQRAPETGGLGFLQHGIQPRRAPQLVRRLVEKLTSVSHNKDTMPFLYLIFSDRRKHNGLAAACRQDEERLAIPLVPRGKNRLFRFSLIGSLLKHGDPPQLKGSSSSSPASSAMRTRSAGKYCSSQS